MKYEKFNGKPPNVKPFNSFWLHPSFLEYNVINMLHIK